jgi:hypothetical protein
MFEISSNAVTATRALFDVDMSGAGPPGLRCSAQRRGQVHLDEALLDAGPQSTGDIRWRPVAVRVVSGAPGPGDAAPETAGSSPTDLRQNRTGDTLSRPAKSVADVCNSRRWRSAESGYQPRRQQQLVAVARGPTASPTVLRERPKGWAQDTSGAAV